MITLEDITAMADFTVIEADDEDADEPKFDFSQEETLLVALDDGNVYHVSVISDTQGWCSCELFYDGAIDYMVEEACSFDDPFGVYVIEGCTGTYIKGDGWMTDDDAEFYPGTIRPATPEERELL